MDGSGIGVWVPDAHEIFTAAVDKHRNRAIGLIFDDAQVFAGGVDRPGLNFRKAMRGGEPHRVFNVRIIPNLDAGVAPPIKTVTHIAAIAEFYTLFEDRRA